MWGRIYAICFVLLVGFSIWIQQAYMSAFSAEFESGNVKDRGELELVLAKGFSSRTYSRGALKTRMQADEGIQLNNGKAAFYGGVSYDLYGEDGEIQAHLTTTKASAKMRMDNVAGTPSLDATRRPELIEMPDFVRIELGADVVQTKRVRIRFDADKMETDEPVTLQGPERILKGRGFNYNLRSGDFNMGGPVRGSVLPPPKASRRSGGKALR